MARYHSKARFAAAMLLPGTALSPAIAQEAPTPTPAEQAKAQAELTSAQLANAKALQDLIAANKQTTEGKATLEGIEAGAEAMRLKHIAEQQLAAKLGGELLHALEDGGSKSVTVVYGAAPPTTAHYLAIEHLRGELAESTANAVEMARQFYSRKSTPPRHGGVHTNIVAPALAAVPLVMTAVSTVVSLLKVDTEMKGAALTVDAQSLGPIVADRLTKYGWTVRTPDPIASSTPYADHVISELKDGHDAAQKYYQKYLGHLLKAGGKPDNLSADELIVGAALQKVVDAHATLVGGLFTPTDAGVLPATVLEQEKALATASGGERVLYVQAQEAGLTSITKKGFLTGIGTVPAFVSASIKASYVLVGGNGKATFGSVSYQTPVQRITDVQAWADQAEMDYAAWPNAPVAQIGMRR